MICSTFITPGRGKTAKVRFDIKGGGQSESQREPAIAGNCLKRNAEQPVRLSLDVTKKAKGRRYDNKPDDHDKSVSGLPPSGKRPRLWHKPIWTWRHGHSNQDRQYDAL
jgi:hypothetical protein